MGAANCPCLPVVDHFSLSTALLGLHPVGVQTCVCFFPLLPPQAEALLAVKTSAGLALELLHKTHQQMLPGLAEAAELLHDLLLVGANARIRSDAMCMKNAVLASAYARH
jgi:hypothetical protein